MTNMRSDTDARNSVINIRVSKNEKQTIAHKADGHRLSVSGYMRKASLAGGNDGLSKRKSISATEGKQIALVLASLAQLADELKAFAIMFAITEETTPQREKLDALHRQIIATRDRCFIALRRKP